MTDQLQITADEVGRHMHQILRYFKDPKSKITVIVRNDKEDQDFVLTNDTPDEVINLMTRHKVKGPTGVKTG